MKSYTEHAITLYSAFKSAFRLDRNVTGLPKPPPELERRIFETGALESPEVGAVTLYSAFKSVFRLDRNVTRLPKLPPELERRIFETCALESPEVCMVFVLVSSRVRAWSVGTIIIKWLLCSREPRIDPILITTVCIIKDFESKRQNRLEQFLAKLTNGKPVEYYAQHIKNIAIHGAFFENEVTNINRVLAICTGVENLALSIPAIGFDFFENPQAGRNLRRLTIKLSNFPQQFGSWPNFYHSCFAKLTHLHLLDDDDDWPTYAGWETLVNLTHLAFACSGSPEITQQLVQTLPTIRYVALGHYSSDESYKYTDPIINNNPGVIAAWDARVVFFSRIPHYDWERGARGEGDFWDLVEREVGRRLKKGSVH